MNNNFVSKNKIVRIKKFVLLILMILFSKITFAQKSDIGNWFIYFGNQQINNKWNWWNEVQYRNYNFAGDLEQLVLRTGLVYNFTENNNNILLGYGYIKSEPYISGTEDKTSTTENRIYEQFITKQNFGRVFIQHRYRLEERFLASGFKMRMRYFLSFNIPINKRVIEKNAFYLTAYNEIFLNFTSPVFDRDRVYGAVGYAINNNFRVETGIMYQLYETSNRPQFQIVFFNNLPLTKTKKESK